MNKLALTVGALASVLVLAPLAAASYQSGDQQQVQLAKGHWWGKVGDRVELELKDTFTTYKVKGTVTKIDGNILTVEGLFNGRKATRPIFASEILSLSTIAADGTTVEAVEAPKATETPVSTPADSKPKSATSSSKSKSVSGKGVVRPDAELGVSRGNSSGKTDSQGYELDDKGYRMSPKRGVFVLPWKDGVGQTARAHEIEQMGLEADKWGPGQLIIMEIESPGGLVTEIYRISDAIQDLRKRHRLVAWIREAISAAACTALHCDEIYFQTVGALGATTMIRGADSVQGKSLEQFMNDMGAVVESNGRPSFLLDAMVKADRILTYVKDPVTGKVTFYDHFTKLPGEVVLSDEKDNLVFNASNALDCGLSKGTADSNEELAVLLGLPEWYEISDYGRKMAGAWQKLYKDCTEDVQKQMRRMDIQRAGGNAEQLQAQIQIGEKLLSWAKRCKPCTDGVGIDEETIERYLKEWRRALAEIRNQQRRTGS